MSLLLALLLLSPPVWSAPATEIRVRVQREKKEIVVTGFGLRISPPSRFMSISNPVSGGGLTRAKISRAKNGQWLVKWEDEPAVRYDSPTLAVRGQMLRLGPEPVPYDLEVLPNPAKGLDVVARLDLESYLAGVLPAEMPASWHVEALKAQAVAARSFVLRTAFERRNKHFDVDSTIMDQVYKFLDEAKAHPEWKAKIARVISDTRGQVLRDDKNKVVKAFYSADCGCQTEDPKFVWGKVEALQSVKDPTCGQREVRRWNISLEKSEVREKLTAALALPPTSSLRTVQVAGKTPSGRVSAVVASLDVEGKTRAIHLNSQEFRRIFGFHRIRSTDFKLRWLGSKMQILGEGQGHAVGLCQTGARALAEGGMTYQDILKLYYPRVRLSGDKPNKPANRHQSSARQPT